jgi:hypothetical protein
MTFPLASSMNALLTLEVPLEASGQVICMPFLFTPGWYEENEDAVGSFTA